MIRNETEYQEASARLAEERERLADHREAPERSGPWAGRNQPRN